MGYTKLFEELIRSSIWSEDDKTRIVWITMLACKDRHHFVRGTEEWLSGAARISLEDTKLALSRLSETDPKSHCTAEGGRRIKEVPGGWFIVSGEYYSKKLNAAERAEYKAEKQREYRAYPKPIKGEQAYLKAEKRNAPEPELNHITETHLPENPIPE